MAFNLERHGIISMDETLPLSPSNYREPAPVFVSAIGIALTDAVLEKLQHLLTISMETGSAS